MLAPPTVRSASTCCTYQTTPRPPIGLVQTHAKSGIKVAGIFMASTHSELVNTRLNQSTHGNVPAIAGSFLAQQAASWTTGGTHLDGLCRCLCNGVSPAHQPKSWCINLPAKLHAKAGQLSIEDESQPQYKAEPVDAAHTQPLGSHSHRAIKPGQHTICMWAWQPTRLWPAPPDCMHSDQLHSWLSQLMKMQCNKVLPKRGACQ